MSKRFRVTANLSREAMPEALEDRGFFEAQFQKMATDGKQDSRRKLHWHDYVRHFADLILLLGSAAPLTATEEGGEQSLNEDTRFDQTRNNHLGNDFEGARVSGAFSVRGTSNRRDSPFPDPGVINLKFCHCVKSIINLQSLWQQLGKEPRFQGLYNQERQEFYFSTQPAVLLYCLCTTHCPL